MKITKKQIAIWTPYPGEIGNFPVPMADWREGTGMTESQVYELHDSQRRKGWPAPWFTVTGFERRAEINRNVIIEFNSRLIHGRLGL